MVRAVMILLVSATMLSGCATVRDSRLNPFNWFGRSTSEPVSTEATGVANPLIPRRRASIFFDNQPEAYGGRPVQEVTELLVERRPGGAIIRVTGVAGRVGPFEVRLTEDEAATDDDTLAYTLRALQQPGPRSTGPRARMVTAAVWLTDQELFGIREIRVSGATNSRVTRR